MTATEKRHAATDSLTGQDSANARSSFTDHAYQPLPITIGNGYPPPNGPIADPQPPPKPPNPSPNPPPGIGLRPTWHPPRNITWSAAEVSEGITQSNARLALARLPMRERSALTDSDLPPPETDTATVLAQFTALGRDTEKLAEFEAASVNRSKAFVGGARARRADPPVAGAARLHAAKSRLLSAGPASTILLPVQAQRFSRHRFPIPHGGGLDNGPAFLLNNDVVQFSTEAQGANWGWGPDDEASAYFFIFWSFVFTPSWTANYKFTAAMWFSGDYLVTADDRAWNSKNASATLRCDIEAGPLDGNPVSDAPVLFWEDRWPSAGSDPKTIFHADNDNIDVSGTIEDVELLVYQTFLCDGMIEADTPTLIQCFAFGGVDAKGGGSRAELDFSGPGRGIGCPFLRVDRID